MSAVNASVLEKVSSRWHFVSGSSVHLFSHTHNMKRDVDIAMKIRAKVAALTGVPVTDINSKLRTSKVVDARYISTWLVKQKTSLRLREIAPLHGKKKHVSVIYACSIVKGRMEVDKAFRKMVNEISTELDAEISLIPASSE